MKGPEFVHLDTDKGGSANCIEDGRIVAITGHFEKGNLFINLAVKPFPRFFRCVVKKRGHASLNVLENPSRIAGSYSRYPSALEAAWMCKDLKDRLREYLNKRRDEDDNLSLDFESRQNSIDEHVFMKPFLELCICFTSVFLSYDFCKQVLKKG